MGRLNKILKRPEIPLDASSHSRATLICVGAFVVAGKPDKATDHKEGKPQQEVNAAPTSKGTHNPDTHTGKADGDPPKWYASLKRPEWWLVVDGGRHASNGGE
jgi:hypothetical protein